MDIARQYYIPPGAALCPSEPRIFFEAKKSTGRPQPSIQEMKSNARPTNDPGTDATTSPVAATPKNEAASQSQWVTWPSSTAGSRPPRPRPTRSLTWRGRSQWRWQGVTESGGGHHAARSSAAIPHRSQTSSREPRPGGSGGCTPPCRYPSSHSSCANKLARVARFAADTNQREQKPSKARPTTTAADKRFPSLSDKKSKYEESPHCCGDACCVHTSSARS